MFSSEKTINSLTELFVDVKEYFLLQKEYMTLDLVEKLTILLSAISLGFILMCISLLVLFYLSFTLIYFMAPMVGGLTVAFAIMTAILLLLAIVLYVKRQSWIIAPITKGIASVLLADNEVIEATKNESHEAE